MAQLVVRNLPDAVKDRLKRRAKHHGRSLEAEVRAVLEQVPEPAPPLPKNKEGLGTQIARRMRALGVTKEDIDSLNETIAELRHDQRIHDIDK